MTVQIGFLIKRGSQQTSPGSESVFDENIIAVAFAINQIQSFAGDSSAKRAAAAEEDELESKGNTLTRLCLNWQLSIYLFFFEINVPRIIHE